MGRRRCNEIIGEGARLYKTPRLNIIVIWILSSDTVTICQLNQFNTNSEAAMLSKPDENTKMKKNSIYAKSGIPPLFAISSQNIIFPRKM